MLSSSSRHSKGASPTTERTISTDKPPLIQKGRKIGKMRDSVLLISECSRSVWNKTACRAILLGCLLLATSVSRGDEEREKSSDLVVPAPKPLLGEDVFKAIPKEVPLPKHDIVIEAENFQFMTYGWEIGESNNASGGAYIHMKEGVGDFESEDLIAADPSSRAGDFYNVTGDRRRIEARCYFNAPRSGMYHVAVRTMGHGPCSMVTSFSFNQGQKLKAGLKRKSPFVWRWHYLGRVHLREGVNYASCMAYQDDVKVDQIVVSESSLKMLMSPFFSGTYRGTHPAPVRPSVIDELSMSLTTDGLAIKQGKVPSVSIYIHKNVPGEIDARLVLSVEDPRLIRQEAYAVKIGESSALARFPWKLELPRPLEKKEYLLRCSLFVGSKLVAERKVVLSRGYDWAILGPLPYVGLYGKGKVVAGRAVSAEYHIGGKLFRWQQYSEEYTDHFGLMDFKKMFAKKHAVPAGGASLYAYTEVDAPESGTYLLKAQGDDDLIMWVGGERVVTITALGPAIRTARETKIKLSKGRNRMLLRLNHRQAKWQAGIRIRAAEDGVADVKGIPFADQDLDFE